jgi:hypothetical protein
MNYNTSFFFAFAALLLGSCNNQPAAEANSASALTSGLPHETPPTISGDSSLTQVANYVQKKGLLGPKDILVLEGYDSTGGYYTIGQGINTPERVEFHTWWQYYPKGDSIIRANTLATLRE